MFQQGAVYVDRSFVVNSPAICPCSSRHGTSWFSTPRPRRRLVWLSHLGSLPVLMKWWNKRVPRQLALAAVHLTKTASVHLMGEVGISIPPRLSRSRGRAPVLR